MKIFTNSRRPSQLNVFFSERKIVTQNAVKTSQLLGGGGGGGWFMGGANFLKTYIEKRSKSTCYLDSDLEPKNSLDKT